MLIDIRFNFYSDARGGDPDRTSPTLRRYHQLLWSKPLPDGTQFELTEKHPGAYLYHVSRRGEFFLGSDAITHSYRSQARKRWLTSQIPEEVKELLDAGSTIGAYIIFPSNKIDKKFTMNQARGVHGLIDDRFDLTLECIRLYYQDQKSPLFETILRYKAFFDLFDTFQEYVRFFLLEDLIDKDRVKFYLPFDGFKTRPSFSNVEDYRVYKRAVMAFIESRNRRIERYCRDLKDRI